MQIYFADNILRFALALIRVVILKDKYLIVQTTFRIFTFSQENKWVCIRDNIWFPQKGDHHIWGSFFKFKNLWDDHKTSFFLKWHLCYSSLKDNVHLFPLRLDASLQKGRLQCSPLKSTPLHSFTDSFSRWLSPANTVTVGGVTSAETSPILSHTCAHKSVCACFCVMTVTDPRSDNPKSWCTRKHDPERFWGNISE